MGWVGREKRFEGEENPGSFAVCQLYNVRDAGTPDFPNTYREFWDVAPFLDDFGNLENHRIDRGPIYNRLGGSTPDWDLLTRVPMFIMTLDSAFKYADETPIKTVDVFSGKFIEAVKHNLGGIVGRIKTQRKSRGRELDNKAEALGGEMGEFLWREANKTGETFNHAITMQERVDALKRHDEAKWRKNKSFEDMFMPPDVKGQ